MALSNRVDRVSDMIDELLDREERYEVFLNASPWGILVVDQTFHIVYINKTLERMSGYSISELIGEHVHKLMPKPIRKAHVKHEKEYVKNPVERIGNHGFKPMLLTKSGHETPVEISLSPTRIQGKAFFFASIRELQSLFNTVEGEEIDNG
jgi:PAS domain S-box-containing protein